MNIQPEKLFRLLADPTRLRCVVLLHAEGRLCVCELVHALEVSQPKISRHLAHLREAGIVLDERHGQWMHYRLADDLPEWVNSVIGAVTQATDEQSLPWQADQQRLCCMPNRPSMV